MKVKIGNKLIGEDSPILVIAEAGINHNGEIKKALLLVEAAASAGADVIKFQTHLAKAEMLSDVVPAEYVGNVDLFQLIKSFELTFEQHLTLKKRAEELGLIFLSTPFSREAVDLLEKLGVPAFKTGSGELTNLPLLEYIAKKGKPMIISTGMSELDEVRETFNFVKEINPQIILMQCTSTYPAKYEDINLKVIPYLSQEFNSPIGLSDHSPGIVTALGAVALGAKVIEKHFTLDKNWPGPDQKASIDPRELKELVRSVRIIHQALGDKKEIIEEEKPIIRMARESLVSIKSIPAGTKISQDMIWVKRPGTGIPAKEMKKLFGKVAKVDIPSDTLLKWEHFE